MSNHHKTASETSKKADPVHWTTKQDEHLVDCLLAEKLAGNMSNNSFKRATLAKVATELEERYPAVKGAPKTLKSVSGRWQKVRSLRFSFDFN